MSLTNLKKNVQMDLQAIRAPTTPSNGGAPASSVKSQVGNDQWWGLDWMRGLGEQRAKEWEREKEWISLACMTM
jgi:hypothetical protein